MSDARAQGAIELIEEKIHALRTEIATLQRTANSFAAMSGQPPPYPNVEDPTTSVGRGTAIRADLFANYTAPSAASRAYLEMRGKDRGAVSSDEIYEALVKGGFAFDTKDEGGAKAGLRIALAKDGQIHRLPNGAYGLGAWYPAVAEKADKKNTKKAKAEANTDDTGTDSSESEDDAGEGGG